MYIIRSLFLLLLLAGVPVIASARNDKAALRRAIRAVIDSSGANVGVAAMCFDGSAPDSIQFSGSGRFPMQSVYKFPQALAVLDQVRAGRLRLDQPIRIRRSELDADTWSPMLKDHPEAVFDMTLSELVRYAISKSDNNACDILFRLIGGPKSAQAYLDRSAVKNIRITATEREMHADWKLQYRNWASPAGMLDLLRRFDSGLLPDTSLSGFLYTAMTRTENSPARIGGMLPAAAYELAHKTGSSGTNSAGLTAAVNDAGILSYKSQRIGIVVFVSDFRGDTEKGEQIIARISRLLWDYYMPR